MSLLLYVTHCLFKTSVPGLEPGFSLKETALLLSAFYHSTTRSGVHACLGAQVSIYLQQTLRPSCSAHRCRMAQPQDE
jgi:hypothetical protein